MSNAEKQKAWRHNRADEIARYEAALRLIVELDDEQFMTSQYAKIARDALSLTK